MKLYITTVAIAALMSSTIAAPAVSFGVGMNVSTITGSDTLVYESGLLLGRTISVGFEQNFSERFTLKTGVALESRGEGNRSSIVHDATFSEDRNEVLDILNLQLPVLAQFNIPLSILAVNVYGGPEVGVFLSGKRRSENISNFAASGNDPARSATAYDTTNFSRDMKLLDVGLRVGLGLELKTGTCGAFFFRPSAYIGAIDILQTGHEKESNANLKGKHQAFSFALGYKFNFNPKINSASSYKSSSKPSSTVKEDGGYNVDNYKTETSTQGSSSQESTPASDPDLEVDDLE